MGLIFGYFTPLVAVLFFSLVYPTLRIISQLTIHLHRRYSAHAVHDIKLNDDLSIIVSSASTITTLDRPPNPFPRVAPYRPPGTRSIKLHGLQHRR